MTDRFRQASALAGALALSGCASAPLQRSAALSGYEGLTRSDGMLTKTELRIEKPAVLAARTVAIMPTRFSEGASKPALAVGQRALVANAIDRALCSGLADRFTIVPPTAPADLVVAAVVTNVTPTNATAAGVSRAASLGASFVLPFPTPRLPVGLGGLSVEAEARDPSGRQQAAMVWARGADVLTSRARVSAIGDAYALADAFGDDFSRLLVKGSDPMKAGVSAPSFQNVSSAVTGRPKQAACAAYGSGLGVKGILAGMVAAPPEWADGGRPAAPAGGEAARPR